MKERKEAKKGKELDTGYSLGTTNFYVITPHTGLSKFAAVRVGQRAKNARGR